MAALNLVELCAPRHTYVVGGGSVNAAGPGVRLTVGPCAGGSYADAQLDDYHADGSMCWRPPLRLDVRARFSHGADALRGTAGFGFWNDPLGMTGRRRLRLPQAVWFFFGGPATNIALKQGVRGNGWKAATLDANRALVAALLPGAPVAALMMRSAWWYRRLWPPAERLLGVGEAELRVDIERWQDYTLEWRRESITFAVDGVTVLATRHAPRGPLGLVVWIDNQYMVATPQGRFSQGVEQLAGEQWLEAAALAVTPLA